MPSRREVIVGAAALMLVRNALAQGRVKAGVHTVRGEVTINGQAAKPGMPVNAGDKVVTGSEGQVVFVVDRDAMLMRRNSSLEAAKGGLRAITGAVLSVFAPKQRKELRTATATIGVRGTAVYLEADAQRTYACTCYGEAVLEPVDEPSARQTVRTRHHEQPRYIMAKGAPQMVTPAPMINHTDAELEMLEALVGREPPFKGQGFSRY
jgi:ribosomal 50S subunit-recycling heat shock protein